MPTADWSPASRSDFTVRTRFFFYLSRIVSRTCLFSAKFQKSVEQSSLSKKATSDCNSCITCYPGDFFFSLPFFSMSQPSPIMYSPHAEPSIYVPPQTQSIASYTYKTEITTESKYGGFLHDFPFFSISLDHIYKREREQILIRTNAPSHQFGVEQSAVSVLITRVLYEPQELHLWYSQWNRHLPFFSQSLQSMSWRGHVVKINKNCTGLHNENKKKNWTT